MNENIKNKETECEEIKRIVEQLTDNMRREALAVLRGMHLADNVVNESGRETA